MVTAMIIIQNYINTDNPVNAYWLEGELIVHVKHHQISIFEYNYR